MQISVQKAWKGSTFSVVLTHHVLRRYRKRVKTISKSQAKSELKNLLKAIPLDTPKKGEKRYVEFRHGYLVLACDPLAKKWVAVTILKPYHSFEETAKVIQHEKGKVNAKINKKREGKK